VSDEVLGEVDGFRIGFAAGSRIAGYRLEGKIGRGGMQREGPLPPGRAAAISRRWRRHWTPRTPPGCCTVT
jgi:hypothetical protein